MRVLYINNHGGGFADFVEVEDGTTIGAFFNRRMPDAVSEAYLIRVNRELTTADRVLRENDRVTITPTKIEALRHE